MRSLKIEKSCRAAVQSSLKIPTGGVPLVMTPGSPANIVSPTLNAVCASIRPRPSCSCSNSDYHGKRAGPKLQL